MALCFTNTRNSSKKISSDDEVLHAASSIPNFLPYQASHVESDFVRCGSLKRKGNFSVFLAGRTQNQRNSSAMSVFHSRVMLTLTTCMIWASFSNAWCVPRSNRVLKDRRLQPPSWQRLFSAAKDVTTTDDEPSPMQQALQQPLITKGNVVGVSCRLQPEGDFVPEPLIDGIVLHGDEATVDLHFMLHWGNYLPGLHDLVAGMQVGETRTDVSIDAGWGDVNPNLIATLKFAESGLDPGQIKVGTQLYLAQQNLPCTVTEVTETSFTIDANPPLAGASYKATVTLKQVEKGPKVTPYSETISDEGRFEVATFALGCFWGGELEFMRLPGVVGTAVGYTQGQIDDPSYQQVCSGTTGHTEAILVVYDPAIAPYEVLVDVAMDRLGENKYLLNQVGNDKGTQYRHGVYYHTAAQKEVAEKVLASFGSDCMTECLPAKEFFFAEDYHQQYLLKGGQSARKGDTSVIRCYG